MHLSIGRRPLPWFRGLQRTPHLQVFPTHNPLWWYFPSVCISISFHKIGLGPIHFLTPTSSTMASPQSGRNASNSQANGSTPSAIHQQDPSTGKGNLEAGPGLKEKRISYLSLPNKGQLAILCIARMADPLATSSIQVNEDPTRFDWFYKLVLNTRIGLYVLSTQILWSFRVWCHYFDASRNNGLC